MSSATVTETSFIERTTHIECRPTGNCRKKEVGSVRNISYATADKINVYNSMLPKNEYNFMSPIRDFERKLGFVTPLRWCNIIYITLLHVISVAWAVHYLRSGTLPKWQTVVFSFFMGNVAGFGVTGGAHRYWCHRSFKAKWPLQFILLYCFSVAGQNTIFEWVRDHRVHHKFSETAADPHDARRGFFFSHVGWLMMKKHPDVIREGSKIDMSDITKDPLVKIHTRYFMIFKLAFCFILPIFVPVLLWKESWDFAILSQVFLRYMFSLNFTWSVNSFAHLWGNKPYDRFIMPSENWAVSAVAMGEGWHNYHHTFPWDYKASELPCYSLNITTFLLDLFSKIGWAYDLKIATPSLVRSVALRKGELNHTLK